MGIDFPALNPTETFETEIVAFVCHYTSVIRFHVLDPAKVIVGLIMVNKDSILGSLLGVIR